MIGFYKVRVNIDDQNGNPVPGARVKLTNDAGVGQGWRDSITDSSGNAYFYDVTAGITFKYTAIAPAGYSCKECVKRYTLSDHDIWSQMLMTKAASANLDLHVICKTDSGAVLQNVAIMIDGTHRGYTSVLGKFSISLPSGRIYVVAGSRSGYEKDSTMVSLYTSAVANLTLDKSDVFVCAEGATKGYNSCPDGSHHYDYRCTNNRWVPTNDKCPDVDPVAGEIATITNIQYPATAETGDEITIDVSFKNTGTEQCELRARLIDVTRYDTVIDTEPDIMFENPTPGTSGVIPLTTNWHKGSMPETDWVLRVELLEINRITNGIQKIHDRRNITIKNVTSDDGGDHWWDPILDPILPTPDTPDDGVPGSYRLTLETPDVCMSGDIEVSGTAPAGQSVQIVVSDARYGIDVLAIDDVLVTVKADSSGKYQATIRISEFGSVRLYARIKRSGWLGIDVLAADIKSSDESIWVLTYPILAAAGLVMLMLYDKISGGKLRTIFKRGKK